MRRGNSRANRAFHPWVVVVALLVAGCLMTAGCKRTPTPAVRPYEGAPVTAVISGRNLILTNNMVKPVYTIVYPTDILPAIEWAPCIAPESCPVDQMIAAGAEKKLKVSDLARDETESLTIFWWHYLEKVAGASVAPLELEEIVLPIP